MKILELSKEVSDENFMMLANHPYVMSDPIADSIAKKYKNNVRRHERFDKHYVPYVGQKLDNKKLIIWRTGGFGDILFLTPIVRWLKHKYPSSKISVATSNKFKDIWDNNPHVNHIGSSFTLPLPLGLAQKHDFIGIFEGTIESFKGKQQHCATDAFSYNLGIFDMPMEFKKPQYFITSSEINATKNKLKYNFDLDIYKDPYICFQWRSSSSHRDYPYQKLIQAMYRLYKATGYKIVILTSSAWKQHIKAEVEFFKKFEENVDSGFNPISLAGELKFRYSAITIGHSAGLVGIDSALTHIAGALNVPSVSLYGPFSSEWRTMYYQNNISLQKQFLCHAAPCAYHIPPEGKNEIPTHICTANGKFKKFANEKFCHILGSIQTTEIEEEFIRLLEMQKQNKLPVERMYPCAL